MSCRLMPLPPLLAFIDGMVRFYRLFHILLLCCWRRVAVALFLPPLWLLVVTTVFTEGGLGVNGNLLN